MVTGANAGIGKETAVVLAERGARVVMVCRNRARGEPALAEIKARSGNDTVALLTADFASQQQIRALADAYRRTYDRLDVLVNNAGLHRFRRHETEDGIELTWAVNHLAPFLLTNLLLDVLKAGAPARIVVVSSESHRDGWIDFEDLAIRRFYRGMAAYARSKRANVLFTYELARRLAGTGVTATCLHPGMVATRMWHRNNGFLRYGLGLLKPLFLSPEEGARPVVRLAVDPVLNGVTGTYFNRMRPARSAPSSYDVAIARRLWAVSSEMVGVAV